MTYAALAMAAALSSFAAAAIVLSICAALVSRRAERGSERYAPHVRAGLLFRLRVLPGLGAALFGFAIALPTFVAFEPFDTDEPLPRAMVVLAFFGAALIARGAWRACSAWRATARVAAEWKRAGRPLSGLDSPVAVYAIDVPYPIVAVAGVVRPALFIAERLLAECSSGEVRAMIAHETSHIRTFDNARRFVLCACPDLFGDRSRLTRAWKDAAEEAADEDVARTPAHALDLAQALIRVARLAPACAPALASAFYAGAGIDGRVRRLVTRPVYDAVPVVLRGWALGIAAAVLAAAFVLSAPVIHQLMEAAVRLVP
jgi:hypothetical protein